MAKPVILCVDDDADVLRAVERDLRRKYMPQYRVMGTQSGESGIEALNHLKLRNDDVALMLADQRMQGMQGTEFLTQASRFTRGRNALY